MHLGPVLRLAVAGAVTAAALPAAAGAATVTLDKPCYGHVPTRGSEPIVASITGGTPNGRFQLIFTVPGKGSGSAGSQSGDFDAAGNATVVYRDIYPPRTTILPSRGQRLNVSITDYGADGVEHPAGSFLVSTIAMDVASRPRNPRHKRLVRVSATPFAKKVLYGFVTRRTGSRVLTRFRIGRANVCGYAERRAVVAPRAYRTGTYRLWVNAGRSLHKKQALGYSFRIYRSF